MNWGKHLGYKIELSKEAKEDILYFKKKDLKKSKRILKIIDSICQDPFKGIGKPESLKYDLSGCWSRRIDVKNRIVYQVSKTTIRILQCRYHYD